MMVCSHHGGPLDGVDVSMSSPRTPERLFYAPAPAGVALPFPPSDHMLVGYDQEPETPWPGQVEYRLDREGSKLRPHPEYEGMEQGRALYVVAS